MMAALLASLSRSGLFGGCRGAAGVRRRWRAGGCRAAGSAGSSSASPVLIAIAATYANLTALMQRISDTIPSDLGGRLTVWRETWPMARDFLRPGLGVGAFERGMLVYQQSTRLSSSTTRTTSTCRCWSKEDCCCSSPARSRCCRLGETVLRLRDDRTPMFWIRAGAAAGLAAVCAQSIWDTGLRMPANAVLFALVAAVATYEAAPSAGSSRG